MARSRFTRRLVTTTFLLVVFSLVLNSYLGLFPAYISGVDPSTMSYYDYVMSEAGRDAGSVYSENGVIDTQEYAQAGLALICILWLIIDSRRNRNKGPIVLSEPSFVRGSGSKKDPYILQSPGIITAGGSALSQELITIRQMGGNAVRTVVGPQFDISAIEQPSDEEYSDDGDTMVMRLKVDDRDPDDLDEGVYEFMLSFKILSKIHFLWLVTVDYRKGAKRSTKTPAKTKPQKKIEPRLDPEHNKNKPTEKSAGDDSAKLEAKKRMKAIEIEMEAAEATAAAASIAASESRRKEEEKIRIAEIEAKKRMMAIDAEIEARRLALEEMDAKQRKKEEELIRVAERAKEIDFTTLGVAARSSATAPVEKGSEELAVGDTSAFEESGSAWIQDDEGGLSISWTGKTAAALTGVKGLKRAFAAAAVVTARDDLQAIKGVGPFIEEKLNMLGITTFRQVANMTPELEDQVNTAIEFFPGRIRRDKWAAQAAGLMN